MTSNAAYVAFRAARLDDWGQVGQQEAHGKRGVGRLDHCDPARRHLTQHGSDLDGVDPREVAACMRQAIDLAGARTRAGAAVGAHLLIIASGSFFRPHDATDVGNEDPERVRAFREAGLAWARRFGTVAAWRVDMDETTPALDVFLVPVNRRTTKTGRAVVEVSYRKTFGGSKHRMSELQTDLAAAMAHLGLRRGRPVEETGARHEPAHVLNRRLLSDAATAASLRGQAEAEAATLRGDAEEVRRQAHLELAQARTEREAARICRAEATEIGRQAEAEAVRKRLEAEEARTRSQAELMRARAERKDAAREEMRAAEASRQAEGSRARAISLEKEMRAHLQAAERIHRDLQGVAARAWVEAQARATAAAMETVRPVIEGMAAFRQESRGIATALAQLPPPAQEAGRLALERLTRWLLTDAPQALQRAGVCEADSAAAARSIRTLLARTTAPTIQSTFSPGEAPAEIVDLLRRLPRFSEPEIQAREPTRGLASHAARGRGAER